MSKYFCLLLLWICSFLPGKSQTCNNWLSTPSAGSHVSIGELDVTGNQITVEAMINRTQPYSGGYLWAGDVVSKHVDPTNANYLLRPNSAEITTDVDYFVTPPICEIELNKTYHIAMVYDGASLKFYRNGFLMSQVPATGNLYQNDFETWIGYYNAQLHNTSFIGYINEVKIWNVARTQAQLRAGINVPQANPTTTPGLLAYYSFNNLSNKQGDYTLDGIPGGSASANETNPTCAAFVADSCQVKCTVNEDFSFTQDVCNPLTASFRTTAQAPSYVKWIFGDGTETINQVQTSHTYAAAGTYDVNMILTLAGCTDTLTKKITVDVQPADLINNPDTAICAGTIAQLRTKPALSFCWFPTTYLDNPLSPHPISRPPTDMKYYYTAQVVGTNLIVNGDFSNGNNGFTSAYNYAPNNTTEGEYFVGANSSLWNAALSSCGGLSGTGNGNMMMVNGSPAPNVGVWTQTVTVTPNTNYAFSTWIQALWDPNPAQLAFSINGIQIGTQITASLPTCTWTQFFTTWNSGNNTTAVISIVNKNTFVQGNDFALDDISFAPVYIRRDSITIAVQAAQVKTSNDTTVCSGASVPLQTQGANTYTWTPAAGLSAANIPNPVARPAANSRYIVTGRTSAGCEAKDTVDITVVPKATTSGSPDTLICTNASAQLRASGGVSYSWSPSLSLSNATIGNPVATPSQSTEYLVQITDANNCISTDTIKVAIKPVPPFKAMPDTSICEGVSLRLNASGGDQYQWTSASPIGSPGTASPVVRPAADAIYSVHISENLCGYDTVINVNVAVGSGPLITASRLADITCSNPTTQLNVSGAVSYTWSPAAALDDPRKQNPIAAIESTTTFVVTGTDRFGCTGTDSVTVEVDKTGLSSLVLPNAFTPNNDGKNDCFGIRRWGNVQVNQFTIYNRWGQVVFQTKNPKECWDGFFKGQRQPAGGYTYIISAKSFCGDITKKGILMLIN